MSTKLIALTGPSSFTPQCITMIEECLGANFVLMYQNKMENVEEWLKKCDGVVLSGGIDMHPTLYAENLQTQQGLSKFDYTRDLKELMVIDYCFHNKVPVLGICRGHQLMSVYKGLGRDFIMDLDGAVVHQPAKYNMTVQVNEPCHYIDLLDPATFNVPQPKEREVLQKLIRDGENKNIAWVNSWHHQGVQYVKKNKELYAKNNIKVLATADTGMKDTGPVIELMMGTNAEAHWITAQWHPESDWQESTASRRVLEMYREILSRGRPKPNPK